MASDMSLPTFAGADVERGRDFDVADVIAADADVHEARDRLVPIRFPVVGQPWTSEMARFPTPTMPMRTLWDGGWSAHVKPADYNKVSFVVANYDDDVLPE